LEAAGNRFGFLTAEVEDVYHMLAADLSQWLHRSSNTSALRQLLLRWNRPLISLRSVAYDTQHSLKEAFGLPKRAACPDHTPPRFPWLRGTPCQCARLTNVQDDASQSVETIRGDSITSR
jgi:hypothetical protein